MAVGVSLFQSDGYTGDLLGLKLAADLGTQAEHSTPPSLECETLLYISIVCPFYYTLYYLLTLLKDLLDHFLLSNLYLDSSTYSLVQQFVLID